MKSDATVIKHLNKALGNELVAINQYFLHSRMYEDWGLAKLAAKEYEESIDEMKHADLLTKRILSLDGLPNLQNLGKLQIGENTKEMLQCDLNLEMIACPDLKEGIAYCESVGDFVSRNLLSDILESEEEHVDWLESQLKLVEMVGLENYLQSMIQLVQLKCCATKKRGKKYDKFCVSCLTMCLKMSIPLARARNILLMARECLFSEGGITLSTG